MNAVPYPTPAERTDVVKPLPEALRVTRLNRLKAELAVHLTERPHWFHINDLARWIDKRDLMLMDITVLENQITNVWHPVEVSPV